MNNTNLGKQQVLKSALLLLAALIWGLAFVAQTAGMRYMGPFTFNSLRYALGAVVLLPIIKYKGTNMTSPSLIKGGLILGVVLFGASSLQQVGLQYTTVGKAGFITAFYIVVVPLLSLLRGHKNTLRLWLAVVLAIGGLYFLTLHGSANGLKLNRGDSYIFLSSLVFSCHILLIDHYVKWEDCVALSCIQFALNSVMAAFPALLLEGFRVSAWLPALLPLFYAGVFSCGIAYTLQMYGQKDFNPALASLILSSEACFSVLGGLLLLGQKLLPVELLGCFIMLCAMILAQLPSRKAQPAEQQGKAN